MQYIATFYSHFGTVCCKRLCDELGWEAQAMPVPRALSSSCGTCVRYEAAAGEIYPAPAIPEETEQIVRVEGGGYTCVWRAAD